MTKYEQIQNIYEEMSESERTTVLNRFLSESLRRNSYLGVISFIYRRMIDDFRHSLKERDTQSVPIYAAMLLNLSKLAKQLHDVFGISHMTADLNRLIAMSGDEMMDEMRAVVEMIEFDEDSEWPDEIEEDGGYTH